MSTVFSAYGAAHRCPWWKVLGSFLVASVVLPVGVVIASDIASSKAPFVLGAGGVMWALAVASGLLRPNRLTLGLAVLGAVLVGAGTIALWLPSSCECERGETPEGTFSLSCT